MSATAALEGTSSGRWIASPRGPLMTWQSGPVGATPASGVVVLPPLGYQWWSTHRTVRTIAERLASAGHRVARLDYHGTGDSAGDQLDDDRLAAWRDSIAAAVDDLRAQGCRTVGAVGVKLGATFALLDGAALGLDAIAAWAPAASGRRWARELRMMAQPVPPEHDPSGGCLAIAGILFSAETLADVGALKATTIERAPAARVLIVDAEPDPSLAEHLSTLGCDVAAVPVAGGEQALDVAAEDAVAPGAVVEAITSWFGRAPEDAGGPGAAAANATAELPWRGGTVEETSTRLGEHGLTAIVTTAPEAARTDRTLLFLNTGSEPHVGPGRAWVEIARTLAVDGHTCVRADWRGWGESPSPDDTPGRPYDPHTVDDTISLIRALRADGHRHLVLVGLCASAWVALRAVLAEPVEAVVALNPQMYWQPGDPVESTLDQTRRRRTQEIADIKAAAAAGRWDDEDRAGDRPWAARWLDDLTATGVPITLLFAEGDDGIEFLTTRHGRRLAAAQADGLTVRELPEIDHPLHRTWARAIAVDAIRAALGPGLGKSTAAAG